MHDYGLDHDHASVWYLRTFACMQVTLLAHWPDFSCTHVCTFTGQKEVAPHVAICVMEHTACSCMPRTLVIGAPV